MAVPREARASPALWCRLAVALRLVIWQVGGLLCGRLNHLPWPLRHLDIECGETPPDKESSLLPTPSCDVDTAQATAVPPRRPQPKGR